jgi:hypothetical protein
LQHSGAHSGQVVPLFLLFFGGVTPPPQIVIAYAEELTTISIISVLKNRYAVAYVRLLASWWFCGFLVATGCCIEIDVALKGAQLLSCHVLVTTTYLTRGSDTKIQLSSIIRTYTNGGRKERVSFLISR